MSIQPKHRAIPSRELQAALPGAKAQFRVIARRRSFWGWLLYPRGLKLGLSGLRLPLGGWSLRWPRWLRPAAIGIAGLTGAYLALSLLSPWPSLLTVRHILAAPNCNAARSVGLAPARRGEPGYYTRHDADNDGWACEPLPRWKRGL